MTKQIDYFFSLVSPWTYLGDAQLGNLAAKHEAKVIYKPMQLGKVFPATGGLPLPKRSQQRQDYRLVELERYSKRLNLPLNLHPAHFPADESKAAGMVLTSIKLGIEPCVLVNTILTAVWARDLDISDDTTLLSLAKEIGMNGEELLAGAADPDTMAVWDANSDEAIERGVFGSPFYFVDDEPFWGQDRLDLVEDALA
ncbi:MAG: 2-hydroxychromene-2-carboxylate isomerase [Rhodospirillaceae bacterium]|jgi:2-hydroxychromene-2-carboxylate isomerase|nr:2-hydroxychromene-2-carboxylate isomerase [Rhodospirillaceae bacterium]MBT7355612.1 2-hydroxychromene-2-carboxylate isomerase [Rhodospirillaceae bacterium]